MADSQPINVVCAIIEDERKRVFAARRPMDKHMGGKWEFPGGKVEPGEEKSEALKRELHEELAIEVEIRATLEPVFYEYSELSIRLHPFKCRLIRGTPRANEHDEIRWLRTKDLTDLDWAPADLPIVEALINNQKE